MGFLDSVRDALKGAVSGQPAKDKAGPEARPADRSTGPGGDGNVFDKIDDALHRDDAPDTSAEPTATEPTATGPTATEPTATEPIATDTGADASVPPPAARTAEEKAAARERREDRREQKEDRAERREDRQERREDAREAREDAREERFESYTVKSGDSLSEIGARFGVPYLEIARLNNIENPDLIFPGQVFRIPKK